MCVRGGERKSEKVRVGVFVRKRGYRESEGEC